MNEWTRFESWLAGGLPACQNLSIKWKDTLNQTLGGRSEPSEILISMTHPSGRRAPPPPCWNSLGSSHLLQSERALHALLPIPYLPAAAAVILQGWRSSVSSAGVWESAELPQAGGPDPPENIANLTEAPHIPISPFLETQGFSPVFTGGCKTLWKSGYNETRKAPAGCNSYTIFAWVLEQSSHISSC